MIKAFKGKETKIHETAYVSQTATIIGDVEIGEESGVWPGTVIRGDFAGIKIGRQSIIEPRCGIKTQFNR